MLEARFVVRRDARNEIRGFQVEHNGKLFIIPLGQLSPTILGDLSAYENQQVEFDKVNGLPSQVRPKGKPFQPPPRAQKRIEQQPGEFRNPYNFIPSLARNLTDPDFGDGPQVEADRFHLDRYTGRLDIQMTAKTPLLVPDSDPAQEAQSGHKTYGVRMRDGLPWIPSSSVRGMLRSAFEIVTNSRYGVFPEAHKTPLAFRMDTKDGLQLIPARVEGGGFRLYTGTSTIGDDGSPRTGQPAYAAWLGRYANGNLANHALRYSDGTLPTHGESVGCWIERFRHERWERGYERHQHDFDYWKVRAIVRGDAARPPQPPPSTDPGRQRGRKYHGPEASPMQWVTGYVCITNANIQGKHDERVFFGASQDKSLNEAHGRQWEALISNYQNQHTKDLETRNRAGQRPDQYLGGEPRQTAWSRHVYQKADLELSEGTLCYVRLNRLDGSVEAVFPVMIARELYRLSPWDLLHESLRPAIKFDELSPADRVFGWVRQEKEGEGEKAQALNESVAVKSLVRFGPVRCISEAKDAVEEFEQALPLSILGTPKPAQARFYVGDVNGFAQPPGRSKREAGYSSGKRLRGRKVYPHQRGAVTQNYWLRAAQGGGLEKEYLRPNQREDDQNRSILGWIKPGAQFEFSIYVENLSPVELGGLLWLLQRETGNYFRYGGGKPLGFGSVELRVNSHELRSGDTLKEHYTQVQGAAALAILANDLMTEFEGALVRAYPYEDFASIPFIQAFLISLRGYSDKLPTHYPRNTQQQTAEGESFKWFVENERPTNQIQDRRESLPDLVFDHGLKRY